MNGKVNILLWMIMAVSPICSTGSNGNIKPNEIVTQINEKDAVTTAKFMYAELFYQRQFGTDKLWVDSKNVSEQLKKSVSKTAYRDEALEIMGYEGWELVTAVTRNFDHGFEIMFYFRKQVN